jgi:hypothetical protein
MPAIAIMLVAAGAAAQTPTAVRVEGATVTTCPPLNGVLQQNEHYVPAPPAELKRYVTHSLSGHCPANAKCERAVTVHVFVWGPRVWCASAEKGSLLAKQAAVGAAMKWRFEKGRGPWKSNLVGNVTVQIGKAG